MKRTTTTTNGDVTINGREMSEVNIGEHVDHVKEMSNHYCMILMALDEYGGKYRVCRTKACISFLHPVLNYTWKYSTSR